MCLIICLQGCNYYKGSFSDHFDGSRFFNKEKASDYTFFDHIKWLWELNTIEWPEWIVEPPQPLPIDSVNEGELRITYINHATVLIQMDKINILTDPIWSDRAGLFSSLGSKRVRSPSIKIKDLPNIDVIFISHDHYDHLDYFSLKKLLQNFILLF